MADSKLLKHLEVLHEIAMAIGRELDERVMLKTCMPVFLRGLNCTSAAVLLWQDGQLQLRHSLPRVVPGLEAALAALIEVESESATLPAPFHHHEGRHFHAWRMQDRGFLLLGRSAPFEAELYQELQPLADRLGLAMQSCAQYGDLQATRQQLAESERRWLMALEGAGHGVWDWNAETNKVFFSPVWKSMLGYAEDEVGDSLEDWSGRVHPEDMPHCLADLERHFRGETPVYRNQHRVRCKDGSYRWILDQGRVWEWRDGKPLRMVGTHTDVTEHAEQEQALREAREAAEAANQAKSEFLATMSHELRTPMNAIIGLTDLTLQSPLDESQREFLTLVRGSADHLLTLINDILDLSRIEAGKMELHPEDCVLREQLEAIVAGLLERAQGKGLKLTLQVDPAVPQCVHLDMSRLRQVLINLLGNAIKFTEQGGITLRVDMDASGDAPGRLRCVVIDTGIGIAPAQQAKVFEAFTQADSSVSRRYGGSGLGLAISSRIMQLMGGRLWLESTEGEGSRFFAGVPFRACESLFAAPAVPESSRAALPALKVLLAEDVATNQILARRLLERQGHSVVVAPDGLEAVAAWRAQPFDLILMDLMMPELDGLGATRQIREAEAGASRIPIIALTANAMEGDRELCLDAGMDGYVSKPLTPASLFAEIERVLRG